MNLSIEKIVKYSKKAEIEPANVFFETNIDHDIVEYSKNKKYVRFIDTLTLKHSTWIPLENNSSARRMKFSNRYQVVNKQRAICFSVWE